MTTAAREVRPGPMYGAARVIENRWVTDRYWQLDLALPQVAERGQPGQFLMLTVARPGELDPVLPRPMALYDWDAATGVTQILYGVVGRGTQHLTTFRPGETLTVMGPVGRGFDVSSVADNPTASPVLVVGRGIGTCSLLAAAAAASRMGSVVTAVESARGPESLFAAPKYRSKGIETVLEVTDEAGSSDPDWIELRLVELLSDHAPGLILTCGSKRLAALCIRLATRWNSQLQVSVEAHMACGLGYCHGCSSGDRSAGLEAPLVCRDGPVFAYHRDAGRYAVMSRPNQAVR